jgi:cytochrome c553
VGERLKVCVGCHGPDGNSVTLGIPSIAGQPKVYLENQLILTREGLRATDVMQKQELMRGLSDRDIVGIAAHFAQQPARSAAGEVDAGQFRRGRQLAGKLHCGNCHLPDYRGREQMPRLAGQREEYLYETMRAFRDNPRSGGDTIMTAALYGIPEADLRAMAHFLARSR